MSRAAALLLVVWLPLLAACGEEQEAPSDVFAVRAPEGRQAAEFPRVGMALEHPANWRLRRRDAPAVFELVSGEAVVAGWAYPREEPLPETPAQLEAARERLLEAIDGRDPEFSMRAAAVREVAGAPAIDVSGEQVIEKRRLATRSVHVYTGGVEYVIEALVPPPDRRLVERRVLAPLLRSLELEGDLAEDAG